MFMPKKKKTNNQSDSTYLLKILLFFILGTFWIRLNDVNIGPFEHLSLPLGLVIGLLFASHEHFQIDRKIEYAFLIAATVMSFYLPVGIVIG